MKMKSKTKSCCQYTQWVVLALLTLIFASCKDNDDATGDFLNSVQKKEDLELECSCMERTSEVIFLK